MTSYKSIAWIAGATILPHLPCVTPSLGVTARQRLCMNDHGSFPTQPSLQPKLVRSGVL